MSRFLHAKWQAMRPYVPGEQPKERDFIKLNTNESPYPPSPAVTEAVSAAAVSELRLYSDPEVRQLNAAISEYYQVEEDQVLAGNGSDEVLAFSFLAFQHENGICFPKISYGFYPVFAELFQVPYTELPLDDQFCIDLEQYKKQKGTVLIANPNAPTGIALSRNQIEELVKSDPQRLVIMDEAYVDFGGETCVPLVKKYDNLLVIQTFSKSRSLAGGRVGFAVGEKGLISDLKQIKFSFNPYNVNRLSNLAGTAAMKDKVYFSKCTGAIIETREATAASLRRMRFQVLDSKANFLFVHHPKLRGSDYAKSLRDRGILVRHWNKSEISDYVRVTIGTPEDMETFCRATAEILEEI